MKVVTSVGEMINLAYTYRSAGKKIGLVPTMGALHRGHLSLMAIARERADCTVMSIFVNPTQFAPNEDYKIYPRPFEEDCRKARDAGCDILFAPSAEEMYPADHHTAVVVSDITGKLCGKSRPTHFQGVTTVVLKLFNIVNPHFSVFGAKDAQQVVVLRRMVADLHVPVEVVVGPIVREDDGLALSSRNKYLTKEERFVAPLINRGLRAVERLFKEGERTAGRLTEVLHTAYTQTPLILPEYIEIVDPGSLDPIDEITASALVAVACRMSISATRLIDNTVLGGSI